MLHHSSGPFLCSQLLLIVLRPRTWFLRQVKLFPAVRVSMDYPPRFHLLFNSAPTAVFSSQSVEPA
jgi:hypothetical protein